MWTIDTPLANARRFLAGQPASHGSAKRLDMQRSSSHRITQSFVGSAIRTVRFFASYSDAEPVGSSHPRYFLLEPVGPCSFAHSQYCKPSSM